MISRPQTSGGRGATRPTPQEIPSTKGRAGAPSPAASRRLSLFLLAFSLLASSTSAQDKPALPRVLILGDSIYQQPAAEIGKELKETAQVVYPRVEPGAVRNSATLLTELDELLGEEKWDVIHFNVGLGDLVHRAPGMKSFRVLPRHAGGIRTTSLDQYEKNLNELAKRLKATGAKVIWASTTPIRHSTPDLFEKGSEVEYNRVAAKVMATHKIPLNDMETFARELIDMDKPAGHGADPFHFDKKPIHGPVLEAIQAALK